MRLDLNKIAELEQENETLKALENEIVKQAREKVGYDPNAWYEICKDELHINDKKIKANKEMIALIKATNVDVGDGISLSPWTDIYPYTIIERKDTPKGFTLKIQRDRAIRTDNNGMSDCQDYRFERDPFGHTEIVKWSPKKGWFTCGCYKVMMGRHKYHDYSF